MTTELLTSDGGDIKQISDFSQISKRGRPASIPVPEGLNPYERTLFLARERQKRWRERRQKQLKSQKA